MRTKATAAIKAKAYTVQHSRQCTEPDVEGVKRLLKEHDADMLRMDGLAFEIEKTEEFIKFNDRELGEAVRAEVYKQFGVE